MDLYAHHAKPLPLWVEQLSERVDLFACSSEDKRAVAIFAVNSKLEPVEFSISFRGFPESIRAVKAEAVCDRIHARQPDIMNHWNALERVKILELALAQNKLTLPPLSATAIECDTNDKPNR